MCVPCLRTSCSVRVHVHVCCDVHVDVGVHFDVAVPVHVHVLSLPDCLVRLDSSGARFLSMSHLVAEISLVRSDRTTTTQHQRRLAILAFLQAPTCMLFRDVQQL